MSIIEIPLSRLVASSLNVRKTNKDARLDELKASLFVHGLLNNLQVIEQPVDEGNSEPLYEVIAGGRRLQALQQLCFEGMINADYPVPCQVKSEYDATEISLAENIIRVAMHPSDQFEAFSKLDEEGKSHSDIAAHFGVSELLVKQRMKLARVSPDLLQSYRDGQMSYETLAAFTVSDDFEKQISVWKANQFKRGVCASDIRRALTETKIISTHPKAIYVGEEAYIAAGGAVERDLFGDERYFSDPLLLERLLLEKVKPIAQELRSDGWKWLDANFGEIDDIEEKYENYRKMKSKSVELSDDEMSEMDNLELELEEMEDEHNLVIEMEGVDALPEEFIEEYKAKKSRLDALLEKQAGEYLPDIKARSGVLITLNDDGELVYQYGLMRPEDRTIEEVERDKAAGISRKTKSERPRIPASFLEELTAHLNLALSCTIAESPDIAETALLHHLVNSLFRNYNRLSHPLTLGFNSAQYDKYNTVKGCLAKEKMAEKYAYWSSQIPNDDNERWNWIVSLKSKKRRELLAYCVANMVNTIKFPTPANHSPKPYETFLLHHVPVNFSYYWEPTIANYCSIVPKPALLKDLEEIRGAREARHLQGKAKKEIAPYIAKILEGKNWVPPELRPLVAFNPPFAVIQHTEDEATDSEQDDMLEDLDMAA